jgi:hypothetical protein
MGGMNYLERLAQRATGNAHGDASAEPRIRTTVDGPDPMELPPQSSETLPPASVSPSASPRGARSPDRSVPPQAPTDHPPGPRQDVSREAPPAALPFLPQAHRPATPAPTATLRPSERPDARRHGSQPDAKRPGDATAGGTIESFRQQPASAAIRRPHEPQSDQPDPGVRHPIAPAAVDGIISQSQPPSRNHGEDVLPVAPFSPQPDVSRRQIDASASRPTGSSAPRAATAPAIHSLDDLLSLLPAGEVMQQPAAALSAPSRRPSVRIGRLLVEVTPPAPTPTPRARRRNRRRGGTGPEASPASFSSLRFGLGQR